MSLDLELLVCRPHNPSSVSMFSVPTPILCHLQHDSTTASLYSSCRSRPKNTHHHLPLTHSLTYPNLSLPSATTKHQASASRQNLALLLQYIPAVHQPASQSATKVPYLNLRDRQKICTPPKSPKSAHPPSSSSSSSSNIHCIHTYIQYMYMYMYIHEKNLRTSGPPHLGKKNPFLGF